MGHSTIGGPKGLGSFTNTPSTTADFNKARDLIALMGNYRGAVTEAARDLITGGALYAGLAVYNTDRSMLEVYDGSGWVPAFGEPTFTTITYSGIYSAGTPSPRLVLLNGWYALEGVVVSSTATFVAGTTYTIGTIPSAKAPAFTRTFPIMVNSVFGWVSVDTSGNITLASSVGFTGGLIAHINGARWPDKTL